MRRGGRRGGCFGCWEGVGSASNVEGKEEYITNEWGTGKVGIQALWSRWNL